MQITGHTRVFGILADPIAQVKTPQMLNALMAERGFDGVLVPFWVAPDGLADLVAGMKACRSLGGLIVTVPHKTAVLALCDEISDVARHIGAANVIRREADGRLVATMYDGAGFLGGLRESGIEPGGRAVYLAGAGGAANAIAFSLAEAGVSRLTIANRTRAKAEDLRERLARVYPDVPVAIGSPDASGHDIVVNATSLGLKLADPLPLDAASLSPGMIVAEIIMDPEITPLLATAREKGCRIHPGWPMLERQRELMAEFLGIGP
jgi:shikimate dehydrogenase